MRVVRQSDVLHPSHPVLFGSTFTFGFGLQMSVHHVKDAADYQSFISRKGFVVVDFSASW